MREAGVGTWRVELAWDQVEPRRGELDWRATDRKVLAAARQGIDVLGLLLRAPAWANGSPVDPFEPPRSGLLSGFAQAAAARYGAGGTLWRAHPRVPARPVADWQAWKEPNLPRYLPCATGPGSTRGCCGRSTRGSRDRTPPRGSSWRASPTGAGRTLRRLLRRGGALPSDVAAVHPFSRRPSRSPLLTDRTRRVLDQEGRRRAPLWLTEMTCLRLERVLWSTWASVDRGSPNAFDSSGLRGTAASGALVDKPALAAFRAGALAAQR